MKIITNNDQIIIIWKDRFTLSSPLKNRENALDILRNLLKYELYTVNRLDYKAAGLMVVAKTKKVCDDLRYNWSTSKKAYLILTKDRIKLGKHHFNVNRKGHKVFLHKNGEHQCISYVYTSWCVSENIWCSKVVNQTGFTHQLRLLAKKERTNILGEDLYAKTDEIFNGLAIECIRLRIQYYNGTVLNVIDTGLNPSNYMQKFIINKVRWRLQNFIS